MRSVDRMTEKGYEKYWRSYPFHFQEMHGVPPTKRNIREAYGRLVQSGVQKMVQEWGEEVRELSESRDARGEN